MAELGPDTLAAAAALTPTRRELSDAGASLITSAAKRRPLAEPWPGSALPKTPRIDPGGAAELGHAGQEALAVRTPDPTRSAAAAAPGSASFIASSPRVPPRARALAVAIPPLGRSGAAAEPRSPRSSLGGAGAARGPSPCEESEEEAEARGAGRGGAGGGGPAASASSTETSASVEEEDAEGERVALAVGESLVLEEAAPGGEAAAAEAAAAAEGAGSAAGTVVAEASCAAPCAASCAAPAPSCPPPPEEDEGLWEWDPYAFIARLPSTPGALVEGRAVVLPRRTRRSPRATLVLDLDETLVHSTLMQPGVLSAGPGPSVGGAGAAAPPDFTFEVEVGGVRHQVAVRQRPHLRTFLERVAAVYEVVVFTASQRVYAERLLDLVDPQRRLVRHRIFRDSCVLWGGNYIKDLTVLGRDLQRTVIVDNSPQAFGFQVDNGIPIESWFDDDRDEALLALLPFLESLADAEDVRPKISERWQVRALVAAAAARGGARL